MAQHQSMLAGTQSSEEAWILSMVLLRLLAWLESSCQITEMHVVNYLCKACLAHWPSKQFMHIIHLIIHLQQSVGAMWHAMRACTMACK